MKTFLAQMSLLSIIAVGCFAGQKPPASNLEKNVEGQDLPKSRPITKGKGRMLEWGPRFIEIWHRQWHATINWDGSGFFGFGSPPGVPFGPKTFDVQAIDRELRPSLMRERPKSSGDIYGVTYFAKDEPKGQFYYTKGPVPIAKIFEQFRVAFRHKQKAFPPKSRDGIEKAWRNDPPTPVSKPWDAE